MRGYRVEGIVIKRTSLGEADRILTVVTKHHGKIKILAKGVRKISSRRSAHVELLNESVLTLHEGKMSILTEAETLNHFTGLKSDLKKAGYAFYVCELADGLLAEHQEARGVYSLLRQVLYDIEIDPDPKKKIKKFEEDMLILLGFWSQDRVFVEDSDAFIENIMERRIKTKKILPEAF